MSKWILPTPVSELPSSEYEDYLYGRNQVSCKVCGTKNDRKICEKCQRERDEAYN